MAAYSFQDVLATISGIGGQVNLTGSAAKEGITIAASADRDVMTVGAGGGVMHSLMADDSAAITVTLLKTSAVNAQLMQMFNTQKISSALWGKNTISIKDIARGDDITAVDVAFTKAPDISYAEDGGTVAWSFSAGRVVTIIGSGTPERIL